MVKNVFWLPAACGGAALEANISGFCRTASPFPLLLMSFTQNLFYCLLLKLLVLISLASFAKHMHCLALALLSISIN